MNLQINKSYLWVEGCSVIKPIKDLGEQYEVVVDDEKILTLNKEDVAFKIKTGRMTLIPEDL